MSIIVHMSLHVKNLSGFEQFAGAKGQLLRVSLGDPPEFILRKLLLGEKERPHMVKVLELQPRKEIRKGLKGHMRFPGLPHLHIIQGHRSLLSDMKCQLLQGVEEGPPARRRCRADACNGPNLLLGLGVMDTDSKGKTSMPLVPASGCHSNGADVTFVSPQEAKISPQACAFDGGQTFFWLIKDLLNKAPLPKLGISARLQPIDPFRG